MSAFSAQAASLLVTEATIFTTSGEVPLSLEVAATPDARMTGLMDRDEMGSEDGMLFLFPKAHDYAFWMKNTEIPLDILFINAKRRIVHIEASATPHTLTERSAGEPVVAVIELDGGRASREGVAIGDHVRYELPPEITIQ
jgi:hypothetical protein